MSDGNAHPWRSHNKESRTSAIMAQRSGFRSTYQV